MSAKFLHGISDDPELEKQIDKQIGCMAGFLQLFDRHHILTGKRLYGPKRLAAARSCSNSPRLDANAASAQNLSNEDGQRPSVDSHVSPNRDSKVSSIDCNDRTRQPVVCKEQVALENLETAKTSFLSNAMDNSGRLSADSRDVRAVGVRETSKAPILSREQPRTSLDLSRHSLDIRDLVRSSFHKDVPRLSTDIGRVPNRVDVAKYHTNQRSSTGGRDTTKNKDPIDVSPKSLSKTKEEAHASSDVGKSAMDTKLKKGSWNGMDNKGAKKSSLGSNEDQRFSNEGREILQTSLFEYKDALRSQLKLREAPRLSLDSRARLDQRGGLCAMEVRNDIADNMRGHNEDGHTYEHTRDNMQEMGGDKRRSPSVVARLMGLEALPDSTPTTYKRAELRRSASESRATRDIFQYRYTEANNSQLKSSIDTRKNSSYKAVDGAPRQVLSSQEPQEVSSFGLPKTYRNRQFDGNQSSAREEDMLQQTLQCPDGSIQGAFSPLFKQSETVPKPINMQRSVIETAPWRQQSRNNFQQDFEAQNFFPANRRHSPKGTTILYSEIRKRLEQGGLGRSGKDLETLNQILEAMQLKGLLHSQKNKEMKQCQQAGFPQQNDLDHVSRMRPFHEIKMISGEQTLQGKLGRTFEAPIVIMKPSKFLPNLKPAKAPEILSSHAERVAYGSPQTGNKGNASSNKASGNASRAKTKESKNHFGNEIAPPVRQRRERLANDVLQREANTRRSRTSTSSQPVSRTPQSSSGVNGTKNPSLLSPNKQRITKAETEKKVMHPGNMVKEREDNKGSLGMHSPKSAGQGNGRRMASDTENKSPRSKMKVQEAYAMELHEIEQNKGMDNSVGDEIPLHSDSKGTAISHMDLEEKPTLAKSADGGKCVQGNVLDCCDDLSTTTDIPEQPSPVSVLDSSFYKEECSPSPVMKRFINFKDETRQQDESDHGAFNLLSFITKQCQLDELKLDDPVVPQKPLKSSNDVILKPEMDSVGSNLGLKSFPCSNSNLNSEFYYITDILLISGLIEDRTNISTVLFSSDFPVDPELFFVLEQRRTDLSSSKPHVGQDFCMKAKLAKMNRQLIFNTVNSILSRKLLPYIHPHPWIYPRYRIQRRRPAGKELLKQVWDEFQSLSTVLSEDLCEALCTILQKDLSETLDSWSDHSTEFAEAVLDIERMIFKDLIDEILCDMTSINAKCKLSHFAATPRRQLLFN